MPSKELQEEAPVPKITITIDNRKLSVENGKTILEAARENDINIPALCYHDKVSHNTSCFVCVVKDVKSGQFMPSCAAIATDGMIIESESEEVQSMRQMALNLLLSEHTGDCEAPCTIAALPTPRLRNMFAQDVIKNS
jgi:formate dehydrogenase major subunit